MKNLSQRLEDFKVLKKAVKEGETENGYSIQYGSTNVSFLFKQINNHLIVGRHRKNPYWGDGNAIRVLDLDEKFKAKKICYNEILKYLRKNSHVKYRRIWANNQHPHKCNNGEICIVLTAPQWFFNERFTKFYSLPKNTQERVNKERAKRGYAPAPLTEKVA